MKNPKDVKAVDADAAMEDQEAEAASSQVKEGEGEHTSKSLHHSTSEVPVSEEFQKHAHKLVSKANKHHLSHLQSKISDRHDEIRAEEKMSEKKSKVPEKFDTAEAPSDLGV